MKFLHLSFLIAGLILAEKVSVLKSQQVLEAEYGNVLTPINEDQVNVLWSEYQCLFLFWLLVIWFQLMEFDQEAQESGYAAVAAYGGNSGGGYSAGKFSQRKRKPNTQTNI